MNANSVLMYPIQIDPQIQLEHPGKTVVLVDQRRYELPYSDQGKAQVRSSHLDKDGALLIEFESPWLDPESLESLERWIEEIESTDLSR